MKIMYIKLQNYSHIVNKQSGICRNTFSYKDYVCQVSKLQHVYVMGLKWIYFFQI